MTDNEIIKALECCIAMENCEEISCEKCPLERCSDCKEVMFQKAIDLINRQKAEIADLTYKIVGIMHSVDKWLEGDELKQDEVNRAITMREKTLQITEKQQAEVERLTEELEIRNQKRANIFEIANAYERGRTEAIKVFAEKLIDIAVCNLERKVDIRTIDNLVAELTEQKG